MAKQVIKRGGKKEPFKAEKIKRAIRIACKDGHVPAKSIKTVVNKVSRPVLKFCSKQKAVKTAIIKKKVLSQLGRVAPAAAKAWRRYEKRRQARRKR